jgi:hypothetical protein
MTVAVQASSKFQIATGWQLLPEPRCRYANNAALKPSTNTPSHLQGLLASQSGFCKLV